MRIKPTEISGNWDKGYVLDRHIISSTPKGENVYGHMQYDTIRTELGELLYHLKYRGKLSNIDDIVKLIKPFLDSFVELKDVDVVIPVPPSKARDIQPVDELAMAIAEYLGINFTNAVLEKISATPSKDMARANKSLEGSIQAKIKATRPHNILLIDDLFETGQTLTECVSVLKSDPLLKKVYVLVMTKTR